MGVNGAVLNWRMASDHRVSKRRAVDINAAFLLALSHDGHVQRHCRKIWQFATVLGVKFDTNGLH